MFNEEFGFGGIGTQGPTPGAATPGSAPVVVAPVVQPLPPQPAAPAQQPKKPEEMTDAELVAAVQDELVAALRSTAPDVRWQALEILTMLRVADALEKMSAAPPPPSLPPGRG